MKGRGPWCGLVLGVVLLAVLPRLEPALRTFHASHDAVEYLLIARSLRAGEGFQLPIRVRDLDQTSCAHEAYGERAPLYPWLLSLLVRPEPGWPSPWIQLSGVALAALAAALACLIAAELARRRGLRSGPVFLAAALAGLSVAWQPFLVRASIHLWAEPLGLCLALGILALGLSERGVARLVGLGLLVALARHTRPEAWILAPVALLWVGRRDGRRALGVLLLAWLGSEALLCSITGVLAPQLRLLQVAHYDALQQGAAAPRPDVVEVVGGIGRNATGQVEAVLLPKNGAAILPLALLALPRPDDRLPLLMAGALALATIVVWSTHDPTRFTVAPIALLAIVAAPELILRLGRLRARRRLAVALVLTAWLGLLGHAAGRSMRGRSGLPPDPLPRAVEGVPVLADPWSYALVTGRPARLDPHQSEDARTNESAPPGAGRGR